MFRYDVQDKLSSNCLARVASTMCQQFMSHMSFRGSHKILLIMET